jgi:hypothetical protein
MSTERCSGSSSSSSSSSSNITWRPLNDGPAPLRFSSCCPGPRLGASSARSSAAVLRVPPGACVRFKFDVVRTRGGGGPRSHPNPINPKPVHSPFPPPFYPASFLDKDQTTSGNWVGTYGSAGYYLAAFDGTDRHRTKVCGPCCLLQWWLGV